jgi:hypothetical protein
LQKISEVEIVIVKQGDDFYGNFFLLVFFEKGKILNIDDGYFRSSDYPFFFDDDYFVIFNDNLYFSTHKSFTTITRIDLKTGEIKEYDTSTPNAPFYTMIPEILVILARIIMPLSPVVSKLHFDI